MNIPSKQFLILNISKSISKDLAKKYAGHYTLNAGCFVYNKKFDGETIKKLK